MPISYTAAVFGMDKDTMGHTYLLVSLHLWLLHRRLRGRDSRTKAFKQYLHHLYLKVSLASCPAAPADANAVA